MQVLVFILSMTLYRSDYFADKTLIKEYEEMKGKYNTREVMLNEEEVIAVYGSNHVPLIP